MWYNILKDYFLCLWYNECDTTFTKNGFYVCVIMNVLQHSQMFFFNVCVIMNVIDILWDWFSCLCFKNATWHSHILVEFVPRLNVIHCSAWLLVTQCVHDSEGQRDQQDMCCTRYNMWQKVCVYCSVWHRYCDTGYLLLKLGFKT